MIIILYQHDNQDIAQNIAKDLITAFADHVAVECICADSAAAWPNDISWDDLLIVLYNKMQFPHSGNTFISQYLQNRLDTALLFPVAVDTTSPKPPEAAAAIKALLYDPATPWRLVNRVGGMLGLRLQGRDSKIFISYRSSDGSTIAKQLYDHLIALGHRPFLDEAKELDGETAILPGSAVQKQIDDALANANLLLLLDTPAAPQSSWIKHEIDTADALLLPVLPVCFRDSTDHRQGPRFQSLVALQRWISIPVSPHGAIPILTVEQLDGITDEAETYMCEIFRRKCRVPFIVEREFSSKGFAWNVLNKRLLMFESTRTLGIRIHTRVLSHCSLFDQIYTPAIKRFCNFLGSTGRANHSLFIYDGELLPPPQLQEIVESHPEDVIILHHQELAALIDSNFTKLGNA